ncbi:LacI family DNA-binding transcriptional regulator [Lapillicoccus sp.]|uniref:LacI family DNA-binding transcriptional regulator n=1 Tax=Lapillicoccus sp. TaxID=1909287 RepID=UPI0025ECD520|nr:LacI family DNA-binding transcriptional regulator [Lapillicoccus sp.]
MTTILDVARASGVSVATVSRALRGLDRVSATTRARVLEAATQLHYVASPTATSLVSGRTRVIGVVTPFVDRWYFSTLISAIEKSIRHQAHHVLLLDLEESPNRRLSLTRDMVSKRVDGVVVLNVMLAEQEKVLLSDLRLPTVTIGNTYPGWSSVRIDDGATVTTAVQHLVALGHTEIAYIGAVLRPEAYGAVPRERRDAFVQAMRDAALPVHRGWVRLSDWTAGDATVDAMMLFSEERRPTAVVAASDEMALGVLAAANRAGLRVPEELSIIGVDDHPLASVFGLTTVRQDVRAQAAMASAMLLRTIASPFPPAVEGVVLPTELMVRDTTGPAGRG